MILTLLTVLYTVCVLLLSLYALSSLILLIAYWRHRRDTVTTPAVTAWPTVAVQLPIYNERYVVERLLQAVANLDYPPELLAIQVLDDSTDETTDILASRIAALRQSGLNITHVRRGARSGYKAGALAHGLQLLDSEFVTVLDADFVPPRHFLRATIPHLVNDPGLGMVQSRWGHLNSTYSLLTRGQAIALDGHFIVEQTGRNRSGWLINFSGSGGVWRRQTIDDAGGWNDLTLTEDLDLSYRAQLKGWRFLYLPSVEVPGEIPPDLSAYKQQQARWARGGSQCMVMLLPRVWRHPRLSVMQRIMATMHLCQYINHPLMLMLLVLTPPILLLSGMKHLPLGPLGLAGFGPPLLYAISQHALYPDWKRRFLMFPALVAFSTGTAWNNTVAVVGGIMHKKGEFKRTPKFASGGESTNTYRLPGDKMIMVELGLSLYAFAGALLALRLYPALVPYLLLYCLAFGVVALMGVTESWHVDHQQRRVQALG